MHAVSMRWVVSSIQCACSNIQGVHRVRVGNSGALALATLAPLPQDDLVRVGVKVRGGVSSCETTYAYEQQDCNVCAKAVPVMNYGGAL